MFIRLILKHLIKVYLISATLLNLFPSFSQPLSGILPKYGTIVDQTIVDFQWNQKTGSIDYTLVLAQDASFTLNLIQSPSITITNWQSPALTSGVWYWKVLSNDGFQITESGINLFRIFNPTDLSNNTLWLAGDGDFLLSGLNVMEWTDMSGQGNDFTQSIPSDQPVVTSVPVLNNKQVVRFDGSTDYLNAGNVLNIGTNSLTTFVLSIGSGSIYSKFGSGTSPFNIHSLYNLPGEEGVELAGTGYQNFPTSQATNYHILSFRANRSSNSVQMRRNFSQVAGGLITGIAPLSSYNFTNSNPLLMGRYRLSGTPYFLNGDIGEVIFYNRSLTDEERETVEKYLNDKYAPPINLGRDTTLTAGFCSISLTSPSGYTNLLWSTGATTPNINVNSDGVYWLRGTNLFGQFSYDTIQVTFPSIPVPTNSSICSGSANTWNADMGPGYTYLWSTGETSPSIDISTPGNYNVTVYDGFGCSKNSGDFTFTIDNYPNSTTMGADTVMCSGNTLSLQVGAPETVSYLWPNGSIGATYVADTTGNYFVETMNVNGCVAQDTITVTIQGVAPSANFLLNNFCFQDVLQGTDLSAAAGADPIENWLWDFGDGNQSTDQNATHIYGSTGTYTVSLYVESQGGCGEDIEMAVTIRSLPAVDLSYSGTCDNGITQFADMSMQGEGTINGWYWNFGQPGGPGANTSVFPSPSKEYGSPGDYTVYFQVTDDYGCQDDTTFQITIFEAPQTIFTAQDACQNELITFTNTSSVGPPSTIQSYLWDFGDNTFSILPVPSKSFSNFGYHTITLTSTASNGCSDIEQVQLLVHSIPVPAFSNGPACVGTFTALNDISVVTTGWVASTDWNIDLVDNIQGTTAYYVFETEGSHNVELTTTSNAGCTATEMFIFDVGPELSAEWNNEPLTIVTGVPILFDYTGSGAEYWDWDMGIGEHVYFTDHSYTFGELWADSIIDVSLYVSNTDGCQDTISRTFIVERAVFDLEVQKILLNENYGFMNVGVQLHNNGTALIDSVDVELLLKNGTYVQERYPFTLQSGQTEVMVFSSLMSSFISEQDKEDDWICATGKAYVNLTINESDLNNNRVCLNREGELPVLIGPFPNPAVSNFSFEVLVSTASNLSITMIDSRGRIVKKMANEQEYQPGIYSFHVPLETIQSGIYFIRLSGENIDLRKKVMVE